MNDLNTGINAGVDEEYTGELHPAVSFLVDSENKRIIQIVDYTDEEKEIIDNLMEYVYKIDDLINDGKSFANSIPYSFFVIGYNQANERIKLHFQDIYNDLRIKYLQAKIKNIEESGKGGSEKSLKLYNDELAQINDLIKKTKP
ncbi:MAG: hypothetical protein PHI37_05540 [Candidatus Gracilibacteria bacterium]|nr:hypothetical protein [Candidatus Gracilibacteria bacterium]